MNILFLTMSRCQNIQERGIYTDLMRKFRDEGHQVYIASPLERKFKKLTTSIKKDGVHYLLIKTLNLQKTNLIEKGVGTLLLESQFLHAIKKYYLNIPFDLVLYSTPPITFTNVINYIKCRNNAKSYLLLKDIFPQNAIDLGLIKERGLIHRYFRWKEKKLYEISDFIGCMSLANKQFLESHNPSINPDIIELNPNSIEPGVNQLTDCVKTDVKNKYAIPLDSTVFVYGGNLGKPQGIDFLMDVLAANVNYPDCYFVIVGDGTESYKIKTWYEENTPKNVLLLAGLPKVEYDNLLLSCDVGLIFLDARFTIPNYPSRLLCYLENKMPVIAATDPVSDIGMEAEEGGYGYRCISGDLASYNKILRVLSTNNELRQSMGQSGYDYLLTHFTVDKSYATIIKHVEFVSNKL